VRPGTSGSRDRFLEGYLERRCPHDGVLVQFLRDTGEVTIVETDGLTPGECVLRAWTGIAEQQGSVVRWAERLREGNVTATACFPAVKTLGVRLKLWMHEWMGQARGGPGCKREVRMWDLSYEGPGSQRLTSLSAFASGGLELLYTSHAVVGMEPYSTPPHISGEWSARWQRGEGLRANPK